MRQLFNDNWSFKKLGIDSTYDEAANVERQPVSIPHDWLIWQAKDLYETSCGWYMKTFCLDEKYEAVNIFFEGVYMDCEVYINSRLAGEWKYGYSSFYVDISDFVRVGENEIAVGVRHRSPNSRWYSGAGIFRDVYIHCHKGARFGAGGVYFSALFNEENNAWDINLISDIVSRDNEYTVLHTLADGLGDEVLRSEEASARVSLQNPALWDMDSPHLYTLRSALYTGSSKIDEITQKVGFKTAVFTADGGFFLNKKHVKLNGVCLHHDLGCLGAAFNKEAEHRRLLIMKEMGVNAVRTSHNMPAKGFMELCDELGIAVLSEAFDIWELKKTDYDYARFFKDWYKKDVKSWVERDRNHASLIMWSIGNEIYDTHASPHGLEVTKLLRDEVRKYDYLRNAPVTIGSNYMEWDGAQKCASELDVSGYNYAERLYEAHHEKFPGHKIYGSETASRVQSRSVYHFPKSAVYMTHDDLQCSSLGNCRSGYSDRTAEYNIIKDRDCRFSAGQFIWTGTDYIGEPTPYFTKNSYFGQVDTAGFPKDAFYLYQAAWTEKPVVHLFPYWDFNQGQIVDVTVYTNQYEVELFLNGKSLGKKRTDLLLSYTLDWQVEFAEGTLEAVAYNENGAETCRDRQKSFSDTAFIRAEPNKKSLLANGTDLVFITVSARDKDGNFVANARDRVNIEVSGAGILEGADNGDSTDYDEYKGDSRKLFGGLLLVAVRAGTVAGNIGIKLSGETFAEEVINVAVEESKAAAGVSTYLPKPIISSEEVKREIPVRKIELKPERCELTKENPTVTVKFNVLPQNSTNKNIEWQIVTDSGIKTDLAVIETASASKIILTAKGDGNFRLRAAANNGKPQPEVISELHFTASGMGGVKINPYKFMPAGLYNSGNEMLDCVAGKGVGIGMEGKNKVGFENVDFGDSGSKNFAVKMIHWHTDEEVLFVLWVDGNDAGEFVYQADFVWQTYMENSFELNEKLIGVHDVCFEFKKRRDTQLYFGGFVFSEIK